MLFPFNKIHIGYKTYLINYTESDDEHGECHHDKSIIDISSTAFENNKLELANTLLHEIMHCCYYVYDIQDKDNEERTIRPLTNALCEVWMRNPEVFKWIAVNLVDERTS